MILLWMTSPQPGRSRYGRHLLTPPGVGRRAEGV